MQFYRMDKILKFNCQYNFIYGGRASGKSYAMAEHLLDDYLKNGHEFVRLLRSYSYAKGIENYFAEVISNNPDKYEGIEVTFDRMNYYINGSPFGHCISLTTEQTTKSNQYPLVYNLLFEEFVAASVYDYADCSPEIELAHFKSVLSTVFRHREGKVWLVGNNMAVSNPYFDYFKIEPHKVKLGECKKFTYDLEYKKKKIPGASVAVEYVPIGFTDPNEIPFMQRIPDNEIATSGDLVASENVTDRFKGIKNEYGDLFAVYDKEENLYNCKGVSWLPDGKRFFILQDFSGDAYVIDETIPTKKRLKPREPLPEGCYTLGNCRPTPSPNISDVTGITVTSLLFCSPSCEYEFTKAAQKHKKNKELVRSCGFEGGYDTRTQEGRDSVHDLSVKRKHYIGNNW